MIGDFAMDLDTAVIQSINYDPETGFCYSKKSGKRIGTQWNYRKYSGNWTVSVKVRGRYKNLALHRVAWFLSYGAWPKEFIDHINCDPSDNRLFNLREADKTQSQGNKRPMNPTSGLKGVYSVKGYPDRWRAAITKNKKQVHLGTFPTKEAASQAYEAAALEYFGEFARLQ